MIEDKRGSPLVELAKRLRSRELLFGGSHREGLELWRRSSHTLDMVNRSSRNKAHDIAGSKNPDAVALGRLGGLKGGKARAAKLTAQERREIARQGALHRWSKQKKKQGREAAAVSVPRQQDAFEIQKQKFQRIPAAVLASYENQFVVSCNGRIVDSDFDLPALTRRFFKRHARKSVYITKVGGTALTIGSPSVEL